MVNRSYLRILSKQLDRLDKMEYGLYFLREKYRIQSELIESRYQRKKNEDPDGEETKYLATISAVLRKLYSEIDSTYEGHFYDEHEPKE